MLRNAAAQLRRSRGPLPSSFPSSPFCPSPVAPSSRWLFGLFCGSAAPDSWQGAPATASAAAAAARSSSTVEPRARESLTPSSAAADLFQSLVGLTQPTTTTTTATTTTNSSSSSRGCTSTHPSASLGSISRPSFTQEIPPTIRPLLADAVALPFVQRLHRSLLSPLTQRTPPQTPTSSRTSPGSPVLWASSPFAVVARSIYVEVKGGNVEKAIRKFKAKLREDNLIRVARARQYYWKPAELKRLKAKESMLRRRNKEFQGKLQWILSKKSKGL